MNRDGVLIIVSYKIWCNIGKRKESTGVGLLVFGYFLSACGMFFAR